MTEEPTTTTTATPTPTSSIVAAVLAGIGLLLAIIWFIGPVAAVASVLLAHRSKATTPRGLWLATIIVGYIGLALSLFWIFVFFIAGP